MVVLCDMEHTGTTGETRRRRLGMISLAVAVLMLIAGETMLRNRLGTVAFVIFWLICLVFTGLAILAAYLDVSALRRRTQEEQRALLEKTLGEIARTKEMKARKGSGPPADFKSRGGVGPA